MGVKMSRNMKIRGFDDYLSTVVKLLPVRLPRSGVLSGIAFTKSGQCRDTNGIFFFVLLSATVHRQQTIQS